MIILLQIVGRRSPIHASQTWINLFKYKSVSTKIYVVLVLVRSTKTLKFKYSSLDSIRL